ncbi:MAG TPA: T9SS type A sorting domain-containing protein [Leeuwenhoekiella sp.]|nr:T9SS type A sorting domain-containing protein [Leeuwenhoekiella sp.]
MGGNYECTRLLVQQNDKIVVLAYNTLVRLKDDGNIDRSFGENGQTRGVGLEDLKISGYCGAGFAGDMKFSKDGGIVVSTSAKYDPNPGPFSPDFGFIKFKNSNFLSTENSNRPEIYVYPNPTENLLNINFESSIFNKINLDIYDILGNEIFSSVINKNEKNIDFSKYPTGIYFLKITIDGKTSTKKIIKK